jgi:HAMP domain-containing protein/CheY-like chemotaxis protein/signal transduction histidine kinase
MQNVTEQIDNKVLLDVLTALKNGDTTVRMPSNLTGIAGKVADTLNQVIQNNELMAKSVEDLAIAINQNGSIKHRLPPGITMQVWGKTTENINSIIEGLSSPITEITRVVSAVSRGDLTQTIDIEPGGFQLKGDFLRSAKIVNAMVAQLNHFSNEVYSVVREVGNEGKLGGNAQSTEMHGRWKELTDSVNLMTNNLTAQVRNIVDVTVAVAGGDLSKKITVDVRGEFLQLKEVINTMVEQLRSFASEVTRVAKEVGTDGKLGGQAIVSGVGGVWKDLTDNVNSMASNLTTQVRNIAAVTTAVAKGDLAKKITVDAFGEILELKVTINTMVDQLSSFASEVTRVSKEVGSDGKLGGQAVVKDVSGIWRELTENVNSMANNLTNQVRNISQVTTAVASGDLTKKITADAKGEILELKETINTMVDQLNSFASEVTRVSREVGDEGKLGGQADVKGVSGTWKDLTDSVNMLAGNLTNQVRNIALVTTSVANGDLKKKITVDAKGEILELKNTINIMVDQLSSFASEVTRVSKEVGSDGILGGQADVKGVSGTWKDLTDSVNLLAGNLTNQVRNIALVTTAVATGDLTKKITVDVKGEILELKNTVNTMVDQLNSFAAEVTRVSREVGVDGKLGGQADVKGVAGVWKDLTDNVNFMASNLTNQVRNIAAVTTSVATGDLTQKITVDAQGEILELKNTINTMVDRLNSFAAEVTRVAREVGSDGKLGGQADVKDVSGIWKNLTDNVNMMANNLTQQVRNIALVTTAVANGDLRRKITIDAKGEIQELKDTVNIMVDQLNGFASEVTRVAREVGSEGRLGGQADVRGVAGIWKDLTDNVNIMATNLTNQVRNIASVTTAVANGDLSKKITVDARGEILELKNTINTMVDQLNSFAAEVTRVAKEVGTEGKLGGQSVVKGVGGTWKDLTDNVNIMANNLTDQVRGIAKVVTAVANGDLKQKLTVQAKGEIAELADTINSMSDTLATFSDQVIGVAREVGVEGRLGGQANVPGAAGAWKNLVENVNMLAANLTTQVRAIAEVSTAVIQGDLTREIKVEAKGEVEILRNTINEMIRNLAETTKRNTEQDWLKTNIAKFTGMLQGQRDMMTVAQMLLSQLAPLVNAQHGLFYIVETDETNTESSKLKLFSSYGYKERRNVSKVYSFGEGLIGQCALEKQRLLITNVPHNYIKISSGLGEATPLNIIILPIIFEGEVKAVIELASFSLFNFTYQMFLEQLVDNLGIVINAIEAGSRTEALLKQSQSLASELSTQQKELQRTNEELEEKAKMLTEQKSEVEKKNIEVEKAKSELEEKATQLAITSKYKSEFLANMSHELRTPLNSLLLLSNQFVENSERNLTSKQLESASIIHNAGNDLLNLINDILDLSKIESGTATINLETIELKTLKLQMEQTFREIAAAKKLKFTIHIDPELPQAIQSDNKRLHQVLKNLLSNAFKFTSKGNVKLNIYKAKNEWNDENMMLNTADLVVGFEVSDTGIGIPKEKQQIIFEAFQQADGSTSRKYGGTGLGLSISREIARLLRGEIKLTSVQSEGSTFTLLIPQKFTDIDIKPYNTQAFVSEKIYTGLEDSQAISATKFRSEFHERVDIIRDDRFAINKEDKVILIVEDDNTFADILLQIAHKKKFKGIICNNGDAVPLLINKYKPLAMTIDINLPDMDGLTILARLKLNPETRHIPIILISGEESRINALQSGAFGCLTKPVSEARLLEVFETISEYTSRPKRLLIIEDSKEERDEIIKVVAHDDVVINEAETAENALKLLKKQKYDCLLLDIKLPGMSGFTLLDQLSSVPQSRYTPVIVHTAKDLNKEENDLLSKYTNRIIVKNTQSVERILDETTLFMHRPIENLPDDKRKILERLYQSDYTLAGKKVLIVDDDIRNIFALTGLLEKHELVVANAENGKNALDILKKTADIDIILLDIMMPEMDGYETARAIRNMKAYNKVPIIAVTAKAMKDDRYKCLEAGASDYITKPVDAKQLLSLMRVWLYR